MKLLVICAVLGACAAGRLDNTYLPPNQGGGGGGAFGTQHAGNVYNAGAYSGGGGGGFGGGSGGFGGGSGGFGGGYQGAARSHEANAQILRYNSNNDGDHFSYDFETSNGIRADASGAAANGVQSHGSFGYKGDDGHDYSITYTADENGYRPQGAHLPTPPPIPDAILKSLEQNARDEAAGISDDGSYRGEGAGGGAGGYSGAPSGQYGAPAFGGGATSRQYLAPHAGGGAGAGAGAGAGGRGGSGNFNANSGYHY